MERSGICAINGETFLCHTMDFNTHTHPEQALIAKCSAPLGAEVDLWLSLSPCPSCCEALINFKLNLQLARLSIRFKDIDSPREPLYRKALRDLNRSGIYTGLLTASYCQALLRYKPGQIQKGMSPNCSTTNQSEQALQEELNTILYPHHRVFELIKMPDASSYTALSTILRLANESTEFVFPNSQKNYEWALSRIGELLNLESATKEDIVNVLQQIATLLNPFLIRTMFDTGFRYNTMERYCICSVNGSQFHCHQHDLYNHTHPEQGLLNSGVVPQGAEVDIWLSFSPCPSSSEALINCKSNCPLSRLIIKFAAIDSPYAPEYRKALRDLNSYVGISVRVFTNHDWQALMKDIPGRIPVNPMERLDYEQSLRAERNTILYPHNRVLNDALRLIDKSDDLRSSRLSNILRLANESKEFVLNNSLPKYNEALSRLEQLSNQWNTDDRDIVEVLRQIIQLLMSDYIMGMFENGLTRLPNGQRQYQRQTYCLIEVNGEVLTQLSFLRKHAEEFAIDELQDFPHLSNIDIWLSFSPCPACSTALVRFIESRGLTGCVRIRFSAIYYHKKDDHREALRNLSKYARLSIIDSDGWQHLAKLAQQPYLLSPEQLVERHTFEERLREEFTRIEQGLPAEDLDEAKEQIQ